MTPATESKHFHRLLLTGAGGGLGTMLRERIQPWADIVRLSDIKDIAPAGPGEEVVRCDLGDRAAVMALTEAVDAVLHFGGVSVEDTFEAIMHANYVEYGQRFAKLVSEVRAELGIGTRSIAAGR